MLEDNGLSSGYQGNDVVHDVTFRVDQGEAVMIIGSNGAGKTTLFKTLCGLLPPSSGKVTFEGGDITGIPAEQIARLGMRFVSAARHLFPRPRDFRTDRFRLVSTRNGIPTQDDLEAVIERGMPGTSMRSYGKSSIVREAAVMFLARDNGPKLRRMGPLSRPATVISRTVLSEDERRLLAQEVLRQHRGASEISSSTCLEERAKKLTKPKSERLLKTVPTPERS